MRLLCVLLFDLLHIPTVNCHNSKSYVPFQFVSCFFLKRTTLRRASEDKGDVARPAEEVVQLKNKLAAGALALKKKAALSSKLYFASVSNSRTSYIAHATHQTHIQHTCTHARTDALFG